MMVIEASLGVGALCETFVTRAENGRRGILKKMHRHCALDPALVAMFDHEGKLLECLDHPGIPGFAARLDRDGVPWMFEGYAEGTPLDRVLAGPRVGTGAAVAWIASLLGILDHVHTRRDGAGVPLGIVHRDVAPGNVLVRDDGTASLLDFGIATSRWRVDADHGAMKGTRGYMAPEVVRGEADVDGRADVFGAGVLLYELLTGARLYGGSAAAAMMAIAEDPVPSARAVNSSISESLDAAVQRCLAKRAGERPTAAEALALLRGP